MSDKNLSEILDKLTKIQALAMRGGTLHEAEVAMQKMHSLLMQHNLTLADVQRHAENTGRVVEKQEYTYGPNRWKGELAARLAKHNMCRFIYSTWKKGFTVIGHPHNLIIVQSMYEWLVVEIDRLAKIERERLRATDYVLANKMPYRLDFPEGAEGSQEYRAAHDAYIEVRNHNSAKYDAEERWNQFRHAFRLGAVTGIDMALRENAKRIKDETPADQWAIVPVLEAEVAAYYEELFPADTRTKVRGLRPSSGGGYDRGKAAGKSINLSRQVGGASSKAIGG
jgi:hypothetical protein